MFLSIIAIALLVFIHELGHYWAARLNGIGAKSFSIGFGPALLSFRDRRGTDWKICIIPLGGYVEFLSTMDKVFLNQCDYEAADDEIQGQWDRLSQVAGEPFDRASLSARLQTIAAGPLVNLLAVVPIAFLAVLVQLGPVNSTAIEGYDKSVIETIVEDNNLAVNPEFSVGDRIIRVGGTDVSNAQTARNLVMISLFRGEKTIDITVARDNGSEHTEMPNSELAYYMLHAMDFKEETSLATKFLIKLDHIWTSTTHSIMSTPAIIGQLISHSDGALDATDKINRMISSPVMIVKTQSDRLAEMDSFRDMLSDVINNMAGFTIMLGFLNLLPLAFLDGGQIVVNCIEHIRDRFDIRTPLFNLGMNIYGLASFGLVAIVFGFAFFGDIFELII